MKYDKFYRDAAYIRDLYLIAENCLNIISMKPEYYHHEGGTSNQRERLAKLGTVYMERFRVEE